MLLDFQSIENLCTSSAEWFSLLADTDHAIADAYNSYGEKQFMGKTYMGVLRKTFLIDEAGKIVKIFSQVKVDEHADEVLQAFGE